MGSTRHCPAMNETVCVLNGSAAEGGGQKYCVNAGALGRAGDFAFGMMGCINGCKSPPANWTPPLPGDPRCHPKPTPTPPPPPPPPTPPPLDSTPCLRFGMVIPVDTHCDAVVTQDENPAISHTFSNFGFGDFSDWINVFAVGKGTITVFESVAGKRGRQVFQLKGFPLTPGPLVVVLKVASSLVKQPDKYWPPVLADSIETIAASYVQSQKTSEVRLFNLSPNTRAAGLRCSANGTDEIAKGVHYSLGSPWVSVSATAATFTAVDDATQASIVSRAETPPAAPLGFTLFLVGLQGGSGTTMVQLLALDDAPEGGLCKPSSVDVALRADAAEVR